MAKRNNTPTTPEQNRIREIEQLQALIKESHIVIQEMKDLMRQSRAESERVVSEIKVLIGTQDDEIHDAISRRIKSAMDVLEESLREKMETIKNEFQQTVQNGVDIVIKRAAREQWHKMGSPTPVTINMDPSGKIESITPIASPLFKER